MGDRVECLLEVHKAHIEWLLVLGCLVHQYSEIRDLISCPPSLSKSRLFICNFHFGLHSDPFLYDPKKDLACMGNKDVDGSCQFFGGLTAQVDWFGLSVGVHQRDLLH